MGAEPINNALLQYLNDMGSELNTSSVLAEHRLQLIWQTGSKHYNHIPDQLSSIFLNKNNSDNLQYVKKYKSCHIPIY